MATSELTTTTRLRMSHLRLSTTARYSRRWAGSLAETAAAGAAAGDAARSRSGRSSVSDESGIRRFSCDIIILKSLYKVFRGFGDHNPNTAGDFRPHNHNRDPRGGKSSSQ